MADLDDVRRIALTLPETSASKDRFAVSVRNRDKDKAFVWVWQERVDPKKPRVPNPSVVAVRVASLLEKGAVLASNKKKFFTEPHYDGFPAVLVRLPKIKVGELRELLATAWRCQAPRTLLDELGGRPSRARKPRKDRK